MLKQDRLLSIRSHHTANAQLPFLGIGKRQDDVGGVDARELLKDRARRMPEACA